MILTSLRNNKEYFWIKVPRTATVAYHNFFMKYYNQTDVTCVDHDPALGKLHTHNTYRHLCKLYKKTLPGVSVARHPLSRFISALHLLKEWEHEKNIDVSFLNDMDSCVTFLKKYFSKNCVIKVKYEDIFFGPVEDSVSSFFTLQISFLYNPNVKYFYYEQLDEFNKWITDELGYDISLLTHDHKSNKQLLSHLDFTDSRFVEQVELMFYDDYKILGYPLQYLT